MRTACRWTFGRLGLALAACTEAPTLGPDAPEPVFGIEPEPFRVFRFQAAGRIDGGWTGTIGDPAAGAGGSLAARPMSSATRGETIYLVQSWTFTTPPDPIAPPDPVTPPDPAQPPDPVEPVTATLRATINLATGRLVLDGLTAAGDVLHVEGQVADGGSGGLSIGGELMFNPQPEPPGHVF